MTSIFRFCSLLHRLFIPFHINVSAAPPKTSLTMKKKFTKQNYVTTLCFSRAKCTSTCNLIVQRRVSEESAYELLMYPRFSIFLTGEKSRNPAKLTLQLASYIQSTPPHIISLESKCFLKYSDHTILFISYLPHTCYMSRPFNTSLITLRI
jgi:hypothetical protein